MRQMTGTMLLLSSAVVMAAPWAHAEEKTIQLTEAEQQEIKTANEKLLSLTLRFLHDSWPLEIMYPGEVQEEFHSILQCHQMLEQFRQTGNLLLQTPDRTTPLHLCIALGLNRLAVRMVEAGAPALMRSSMRGMRRSAGFSLVQTRWRGDCLLSKKRSLTSQPALMSRS